MNGEEIIHSADIFRQEIKYFVKLNLLVFAGITIKLKTNLVKGDLVLCIKFPGKIQRKSLRLKSSKIRRKERKK